MKAVDRVVDYIHHAVRSGRLGIEDRLPTENELAQQLEVSRITVNRGYQLLKRQGMITQRRGAGTFVSPEASEVLGIPRRRSIKQIAMVLANCESMDTVPRENQFGLFTVLSNVMDVLTPLGGHLTNVPMLTAHFEDGVPLDRFESFDAVMMLGDWVPFTLLAYELNRLDVPCVQLLNSGSLDVVPSVSYDRVQAAQTAVCYLADAGFDRIGYMGARDGEPYSNDKLLGFVNGLRQKNINLLSRDSIDVGSAPGEAYAAALSLIRRGDLPSAIFVDTDYKAIEIIRAFQDHGIKVPDDISIMGYDNVTESAHCDPPLTTVQTPRQQIAIEATQMLVNWPLGASKPDSIILPSEIIHRDSVRRARTPVLLQDKDSDLEHLKTQTKEILS